MRRRRKQTRSVTRCRGRESLLCFAIIVHHWTKSATRVKSPAAKGPKGGASGQTHGKPSSKGLNVRFGLEWGQSLRLGRTSASDGGPWIHEETTAVTKAGPCAPRSALPPHGPGPLNSPLRVSLNRLPIFARPPRSQSSSVSRKPKAAGAHTTPRVITPMTLVARSAPIPPHRDENSTAILGAPRLRRGATQIGRNAAPRARPVAASAHHAALSFKREATSLLHVEMAACVHHARKAP